MTRPRAIVVCADSRDYLRTLPADHFHACVSEQEFAALAQDRVSDALRQGYQPALFDLTGAA